MMIIIIINNKNNNNNNVTFTACATTLRCTATLQDSGTDI